MESNNLTTWPRRGSPALREVVRLEPTLEAVIVAESHGISIELSDGRRCYWAAEHYQFKRDVIGAAVQWAHRHGATSVEIRD